MSIGKSSIARAANATATKAQITNPENITTKLFLDKINLLSIAKMPDNIEDIKQSISKRGLLSPVLVAATAKGDLWLLDGYRRFYAAKELGINELNSTIINIENKTTANNIYTELTKLKPIADTKVTNDILEEKFRIVAIKDRDLPVHLL